MKIRVGFEMIYDFPRPTTLNRVGWHAFYASDGTVHDSGLPDVIVPAAAQHAVEDLPADTIVYRLGSRYCETRQALSLPSTVRAVALFPRSEIIALR